MTQTIKSSGGQSMTSLKKFTIVIMFILATCLSACGQNPIKLVQTGIIQGMQSYSMVFLSGRYLTNEEWKFDESNSCVTFTAKVDNAKAMEEPYTSGIVAIGYDVDDIRAMLEEYQVEIQTVITFDISKNGKTFSLKSHVLTASFLNKQNKRETHNINETYTTLIDKIGAEVFPEEKLSREDYVFLPIASMFCMETAASALAMYDVVAPQEKGPKVLNVKGVQMGMHISDAKDALKAGIPKNLANKFLFETMEHIVFSIDSTTGNVVGVLISSQENYKLKQMILSNVLVDALFSTEGLPAKDFASEFIKAYGIENMDAFNEEASGGWGYVGNESFKHGWRFLSEYGYKVDITTSGELAITQTAVASQTNFN